MGVEKYRSAEEMNAAPVATPPDEGFERFVRHCARYRKIAPLVFPRGVSSLVNSGVSTTFFVQSGAQPGRCVCVRVRLSYSRVLCLLALLVGGRVA